MAYRSYMGGSCARCGTDFGLVEVNGGRDRHYCNDACRKAASRERSKRDKVVSRNELLVQMWEENAIVDDLRRKLEDILVKHGKEAATLATEAVIAGMKAVDGRYQSLYHYKGLADEFEKLKQSHFDLMYKCSQLKTAKEILERRLARLQPKEEAIKN